MTLKDLVSPSAKEALSAADRAFVDQVDQEYYTRVRSSETFYRRKSLILENLQRLH